MLVRICFHLSESMKSTSIRVWNSPELVLTMDLDQRFSAKMTDSLKNYVCTTFCSPNSCRNIFISGKIITKHVNDSFATELQFKKNSIVSIRASTILSKMFVELLLFANFLRNKWQTVDMGLVYIDCYAREKEKIHSFIHLKLWLTMNAKKIRKLLIFNSKWKIQRIFSHVFPQAAQMNVIYCVRLLLGARLSHYKRAKIVYMCVSLSLSKCECVCGKIWT